MDDTISESADYVISDDSQSFPDHLPLHVYTGVRESDVLLRTRSEMRDRKCRSRIRYCFGSGDDCANAPPAGASLKNAALGGGLITVFVNLMTASKRGSPVVR